MKEVKGIKRYKLPVNNWKVQTTSTWGCNVHIGNIVSIVAIIS